MHTARGLSAKFSASANLKFARGLSTVTPLQQPFVQQLTKQRRADFPGPLRAIGLGPAEDSFSGCLADPARPDRNALAIEHQGPEKIACAPPTRATWGTAVAACMASLPAPASVRHAASTALIGDVLILVHVQSPCRQPPLGGKQWAL
jgi:hypothetical protein